MSSQKSMPVIIPANQIDFPDVLHRATSGKEHFIVEEEGKPVVAIISMKEYDEFMKDRERYDHEKEERRQRFTSIARQFGEEVQRRGLTEEDLETKVEKVRQRLHEEQYGRKPAQ